MDVFGAFLKFLFEWQGPIEAYKKNGIEQLYIPVVDHYEPSIEQLHRAVEFLQRSLKENRKVYVHCQGFFWVSFFLVFFQQQFNRRPWSQCSCRVCSFVVGR
jgi:hypothetical protein